jgi:two-component system, OmpR family, sensor histidine kinase KdpD
MWASNLLWRLSTFNRAHPLLVSVVAWLVLLVVTVLVCLPFRSDANVGAIALAMLIPPLAATGAGPLVAGIAALTTGLVFNFFFTQPYNSPRIASSASIAAFFVYVVVALIVALAAARMRAARALADRRAADATLMQTVTVELIRNAQLVPTLRSALAELVDALHLRGALLQASVGASTVEAAAGETSRAAGSLAQLSAAGESTVMTLRPAGSEPAVFPLITPAGGLGFLVADPGASPLGDDRERVLESFAGVVALSLERAELAEEGLRRRALEETDRLRTVLMQSVSHDLRTPLTAIKATASALRQTDPDAASRDTMLADIEAEADRLERLVSNLLDLSRIETGTLRPNRDRVPVDELVYSSIAAASLGADDDRIEVELPEELPVLVTDETLMRQVLVNLLRNAARFDPDGRILVDARAGGGFVELRVVDHGPGIPEAERRRLFEPYHRSRTRIQSDGSGLGLVISRGFVEANGGTIRVEPTPGGGATFIVALPVTA